MNFELSLNIKKLETIEIKRHDVQFSPFFSTERAVIAQQQLTQIIQMVATICLGREYMPETDEKHINILRFVGNESSELMIQFNNIVVGSVFPDFPNASLKFIPKREKLRQKRKQSY